MLLSLLSGGSLIDVIVQLLLIMPIILFSLSFHETAHGYVAYKCGDPTAHNLGRLSLNPLRHLDPIGFLSMLLIGYGWAKPVPVNARYFRNPKRGMAITAAAGPISNLLLGLIATVLSAFLLVLSVRMQTAVHIAPILLRFVDYLYTVCYLSAYLNFVFAFFNLIPLPPFDGSRIALLFLPQKYYFKIMRYERQIMFGLLITLFALSYAYDFSPTGFLAQRLFDTLFTPLAKLFIRLLLPVYEL